MDCCCAAEYTTIGTSHEWHMMAITLEKQAIAMENIARDLRNRARICREAGEKDIYEMARLSEEMGLYDLPPQVCIVHLRFVPCRHGEPESACYTSIREDEVNVVHRYQHSEINEAEARAILDHLELQRNDGD